MVLQKTKMKAQVIVLVIPQRKYERELKQALKLFFAYHLPVPVTFVNASSLKDIVMRDKERFHSKVIRVLNRSLIKAGCASFAPS
jgi:hypothetical protein